MSDDRQLLETFGLNGIPEDWPVVRLSSLLAKDRPISVGVMYPGKNADVGIPLIRAAELMGHKIHPAPEFKISPEVNQEYKRTILEGGELLLALVGDVGRVAVVPDWAIGWNAARAIAVVRLKEPSDAAFLRLVLQVNPLQQLMRAWSNTTVQMTLNLKEIKEIPVPWPPQKQREAITDILSAFDDKIELNRQMNRTLEQMARALFQSWFVDFDPVRAKMRGETPEGMDAATAALFPDKLVEVDGREIPMGWRVGKVADVAHVNRDALKKTDILESIDYIEISAASRGDISEIVRYTRGAEPSRARRRLRHGDTVLSTVRPDRRAYFLALQPSETLIASTGFAVLSARQEIYWPFIFAAVTQDEVFAALGQAADGGAYPAINADVIGKLPVSLPAQVRLFQDFFDFVSPLLVKSDQLRRESVYLAQLRDSLLPRLLSGEVDVSEWAEADALQGVMA